MNHRARLFLLFTLILTGCEIPDKDIDDALKKINQPSVRLEVKYTQHDTGFGFTNEILVTSLDNSSVTIDSVSVNNRSENDCTRKGYGDGVLRTGDSSRFWFPNSCGQRIVKVIVNTNRGSFEYGFD